MRISSLKYFYEVAELKSISKVSNNLHISQPALSHQLSKLERELGVKLFERSNRGVELTDKGKILYNYSKEMIDLHNSLLEELSDEEGGDREIRINILSRYGNFLMDHIAKDMSNIFKGINVSISNELAVNEKALLLHNRADILISRNEIHDNDLVSEYIGKDKLILVSEGYVDCSKINNLSVALLEDSLRADNNFNLQSNNKNIFLKTDSFDVIKSYLKNSETAAIVPSIAVEKDILEGNLNRLCTERYEVEYELFITYRKDRSVKFKKKLRALKRDLEDVLNKENINVAI